MKEKKKSASKNRKTLSSRPVPRKRGKGMTRTPKELLVDEQVFDDTCRDSGTPYDNW